MNYQLLLGSHATLPFRSTKKKNRISTSANQECNGQYAEGYFLLSTSGRNLHSRQKKSICMMGEQQNIKLRRNWI
uniref:Uncharacterized protein n=1 Tax=Arundo donax TaxID=35708 RepID=A0A0A8Z035_ARUDO